MMLQSTTPPPSAAPPVSPGLVLRDIHLPPNPSWWPPAPGWWVLAALLLILIGIIVLIWHRRRRRVAWQRRALDEIDALAARHADDDAALAAGLHQLLRRAARRYEPTATQQRGEPWRQTLEQVPVDVVTLDVLATLEQRMYQPLATFDRLAALAATRHWLAMALRRTPRMGKEAKRA
ncbi:MAG: DUF4381 domain-containing protein [Rhodanobacter sp.]